MTRENFILVIIMIVLSVWGLEYFFKKNIKKDSTKNKLSSKKTSNKTNSPTATPNAKVNSNSAVLNPVVSNSAVSKPVVSNPLVSKPVVSNPLVSKPVVSNLAVSNPVVSKPVVTPVVVEAPKKIMSESPSIKKARPSQSSPDTAQLLHGIARKNFHLMTNNIPVRKCCSNKKCVRCRKMCIMRKRCSKKNCSKKNCSKKHSSKKSSSKKSSKKVHSENGRRHTHLVPRSQTNIPLPEPHETEPLFHDFNTKSSADDIAPPPVPRVSCQLNP